MKMAERGNHPTWLVAANELILSVFGVTFHNKRQQVLNVISIETILWGFCNFLTQNTLQKHKNNFHLYIISKYLFNQKPKKHL